MDIRVPSQWRATLGVIQQVFPEAVIAGGALRDILTGREPKDVDIFVQRRHESGMETKRKIAELFQGSASKMVINDEFAQYSDALDGVAWAVELALVGHGMPYQIIALDCPVTAHAAVERIDFGICRVAYDGHLIFRHPDFIHDFDNHCFTYVATSRSPAQMDRSFQRYARLQAKFAGWPLKGMDDYLHPAPLDWDVAVSAPTRYRYIVRCGDNKFGFSSCPLCTAAPETYEFRDRLSAKEYRISGLCQSCQDGFFTL